MKISAKTLTLYYACIFLSSVCKALTVIGGILDIMLAYDIDETPSPDISTELTILCRQLNHRKPSIGEIALNQPPSNPVLVRLHRQLLTTMRLANGLKLSNSLEFSNFSQKLVKQLRPKNFPLKITIMVVCSKNVTFRT